MMTLCILTFSSPEAALLLVSTKNRDLWPCPTPEVRDSRTSRHSAHAQSQVWQIWLVLVSTYCVFKAIQNQNVVGRGQRSRFLVLTKRSAASGDENGILIKINRCVRIVLIRCVRLVLIQNSKWRRFCTSPVHPKNLDSSRLRNHVIGEHRNPRDHDLREYIPHTWASSHDNLFQSNFSAWSSREAILGTTPDWPT